MRQTEKAQAYADANGLILDKELEDVGSGFHGKHVRFGELGGFLRLVDQGKVAVGSYLIVESLDRLSREDVLIAQAQFIELLIAGISIVTLIDNQVYHKDRDYTQLILSLSIMKRANDESLTKQARTKDNLRRNKLEALDGKPRFNIHCVNWIDQTKIPGTRKDYAFSLNEHAKTVRMIFDYYASGLGLHSIARLLNERQIPVLRTGVARHWRAHTIQVILSNETAIGTYHVTEKVNGQVVPLGEPIRNYYPAAVPEDLFWRVQKRRTETAVPGRKGKGFANLLNRLTRCASCGNTMKVSYSGGRNKNRSKLYACSGKFAKGTVICDTSPSSIPYVPIETAILDHVTDFHLDTDLNGNKTLQRSEVEASIARLEADIQANTKKRQNFILAVGSAEDEEERMAFQNQSSETRKLIEADKARLLEFKQLLRDLSDDQTDLDSVADMIAAEREMWKTGTNEEVQLSRARVSLALRKFISAVEVDLEQQMTTVFVGGSIKGYRFNRKGELIGKYDMTEMFRPVQETYTIIKDGKTIRSNVPTGKILGVGMTKKHLEQRLQTEGRSAAEISTSVDAAQKILSQAGIKI